MILRSLADTRLLAESLAESVPAGGPLVLSGPLGAGKTTFVRMLVEALGSDAQVSSPTYTLVHEYPTPAGTIVHIDAYRLGDARALFDLGLDEYLDRARLVVVEWGEALLEEYPDATVLRLELDGDERRATLARGGRPAG